VRVSVVVCEHTLDRYEDLQDAVGSLLSQTHDDTEIVLVSDGNERVCGRMRDDYGDKTDIIVQCLDENVGLLGARNAGAEVGTGDVIAFIDDDAIADERWIAELVDVYESRDAPAAGGKMTPEWVAGKPSFLPEEFYWLVGVTHRGFADGPGEVRNTFGSNISFRGDVFAKLGGFDVDMGGRKGEENLQGGETELCARLHAEYGKGVWYVPEAKVAHKVFEYRTRPVWLLKRAFWQGYSKRAMEKLVPESGVEESAFLGNLFLWFMPDRLRNAVFGLSWTEAKKFVMLVVFTALVGCGYLYAFKKWR